MKISIDSAEPLEDVMRVVGAMYGVTLAVAMSDTETQIAPKPTAARAGDRFKAGRKTTARGNSRRRSTARSRKVSAAELRTWAQENGHTVSERGPIPAAVRSAYQDARGR